MALSPVMLFVASVCGVTTVWIVVQFAYLRYYLPEMPLGLVASSLLLRALGYFGVKGAHTSRPLDLERTLRKAHKDTGVPQSENNAATERTLQLYKRLYGGELMRSMRYSPTGRIAAAQELLSTMARRLRFGRFVASMPSVRDVPLQRPVFVLGLARTGTTFTHRLLSMDSATRAPLTWELDNPIPMQWDKPDDAASLQADYEKRRKYSTKKIKNLIHLVGGLLTRIHKVGADLPEECLIALANDLPLSLHLLAALTTDYEHFIHLDTQFAYENYKELLQTLSWQHLDEREAPRRWTLKCPAHLMWIDAIARVFPDAIIVRTHRHPVDAIPSLASLWHAIHNIYFEPADWKGEVTARQILAYSSESVRKASDDIEQTGITHVDVRYDDLMADPVATVRKIYDQTGLEFTPEYEKTLTDFVAKDAAERNKLKRSGTGKLHHYTAEEYGLSTKEIEDRMAEYMQEYNFERRSTAST